MQFGPVVSAGERGCTCMHMAQMPLQRMRPRSVESSAQSCARDQLCAATMARELACHVCAGTGLTAATSAPGLASLLPHLRRDWPHCCHICAGTGLTAATSARKFCMSAPASACAAPARTRVVAQAYTLTSYEFVLHLDADCLLLQVRAVLACTAPRPPALHVLSCFVSARGGTSCRACGDMAPVRRCRARPTAATVCAGAYVYLDL